MKTARLLTLLGSILLVASAAFHTAGYWMITASLAKEPIRAELANAFKACWLAFSVAMIALAVVAFVARSFERGGVIVLLCATASAGNVLLMLRFLGPFIGVYLVTIVTLLFLAGGYLQLKAPSRPGSGA